MSFSQLFDIFFYQGKSLGSINLMTKIQLHRVLYFYSFDSPKLDQNEKGRLELQIIATLLERKQNKVLQKWANQHLRPCGLMDKAPDFGSGDCRFESCHGRYFLSFESFQSASAMTRTRTRNKKMYKMQTLQIIRML